MGEEVFFVIELDVETPNQAFVVGLHFYDWRGQRVTSLHTAYQSTFSLIKPAGLSCDVMFVIWI